MYKQGTQVSPCASVFCSVLEGLKNFYKKKYFKLLVQALEPG